jgi:hypothetical protein
VEKNVRKAQQSQQQQNPYSCCGTVRFKSSYWDRCTGSILLGDIALILEGWWWLPRCALEPPLLPQRRRRCRCQRLGLRTHSVHLLQPRQRQLQLLLLHHQQPQLQVRLGQALREVWWTSAAAGARLRSPQCQCRLFLRCCAHAAFTHALEHNEKNMLALCSHCAQSESEEQAREMIRAGDHTLSVHQLGSVWSLTLHPGNWDTQAQIPTKLNQQHDCIDCTMKRNLAMQGSLMKHGNRLIAY